MFRKPIAVIPKVIGEPGEIHGIAQSITGCHPFGNRRLVKNTETDGHEEAEKSITFCVSC